MGGNQVTGCGVDIRDLSVKYGRTLAVDKVSLSVRPGEFFFLLGPSGCGKTSLLRAISGLEPAAGGKVFIGDRDVTRLPTYKRGAPMVFQGYALWPHMSILDNAAYGLEARGVPGKEARERAAGALKMVGLEKRAKSKPAQLSGGQQQRVALARALAVNPELVLLDEPLSNLDAKLRREMRTELVRLHREAGFTAIYVTHDQEEALSMAQRVALMREGRVVEMGSPRELYTNPETRFGAEFLGEVNWVPAKIAKAHSSGKALFTSALGEVLLPAPAKKSRSYLLGFRPEKARPGLDPKGGLQISGNISSVSFLGGSERIEVPFGEGGVLVLRMEAQGLRAGSQIAAHVSSASIWAIPGGRSS